MPDGTDKRELLRECLVDVLLNPSDALVQDLRDSVEAFADRAMTEASARVTLRDLARIIAEEAGIELPDGEAGP